jgi:protocatechuate 3,4-dioxygenase, beta subunit
VKPEIEVMRAFGAEEQSLDPHHEPYRSTEFRFPRKPLLWVPHTLTELTGPVFGTGSVGSEDHDLTLGHAGLPAGQRIAVSGKVTDGHGHPVRQTLIEIWQANAAGRYVDHRDASSAPLDVNFTGAGRCLTDDDGQYRFITIRPGCYPWGNHYNAWRPAHIHFSLFGEAFATRLVTQMYFPGDPLLDDDPIFNAVRDRAARLRLVSSFDWNTTVPNEALGFRFDIVLRGLAATPMED